MWYRVIYRDPSGAECRSRTMTKRPAIETARALARERSVARVIRDADGAELVRFWHDPRSGLQWAENPEVAQHLLQEADAAT